MIHDNHPSLQTNLQRLRGGKSPFTTTCKKHPRMYNKLVIFPFLISLLFHHTALILLFLSFKKNFLFYIGV